MSFCYETTRISVRTDLPDMTFDPMRCNATKCHIDHYKNHLFLTFMSNNGTMAEKKQAAEELKICERKMAYWARQPHFNHAEALAQKERLHKRARL